MKHLNLIIVAALSTISTFTLAAPFSDRIDAVSAKIAKACYNGSTDMETVRCLNKGVAFEMQNDLQAWYKEQMMDFAKREGLESLQEDQVKKLYELFPVMSPTENELKRSQLCVSVGTGLGITRFSKLKQLSKVMLETAMFAGQFSMLTLGKPFSPILNFGAIHICEDTGRVMKLNRERRVLEIGFSYTGVGSDLAMGIGLSEQIPFTAELLWNQWQKGEAVNPRPAQERGLIRSTFSKVNYVGLSPQEMIDEAIYQKWSKLNPTGELRKSIRLMAYKFVVALTSQMMSNERRSFEDISKKIPAHLQSLLTGIQTDSIPGLMKQIADKLQSPELIEMGVTKHLAMAANTCQGVNLETNSARDLKGTVVVTNLKAVAVHVDFNFPMGRFDDVNKELYTQPDRGCVSSKVDNKDKVDGFVVFNGIDNVGVSVAGLARLTDALIALPQVVLLNVLEASAKKK